MADWELRLTATAQHHERGSYCILIASPGKDQHSQFKVRFLLNAYRTTVKSKSCKSNHRELGPSLIADDVDIFLLGPAKEKGLQWKPSRCLALFSFSTEAWTVSLCNSPWGLVVGWGVLSEW